MRRAATAGRRSVAGQFLKRAMDKMERVGPSGLGGVVLWPRRVYSRKKRAGERLNLTPKPDPALPGKTEAPPPGRISRPGWRVGLGRG